MHLTTDEIILYRHGFIVLNATLVYTWVVMLLLTVMSWLVTRNISLTHRRSRWQNALEVIVSVIRQQAREIGGKGADFYVPFVGTLFLFIALSNLLDVVPGWHAPTGSLSTTIALAICVAVHVPILAIREQGCIGYLRHYVSPTVVMLPLHIVSEFSRTLALAVRLFGNVMSGGMIVGILLAIVPLFFPVAMQVLGLLTGIIQAYIFAILATVYIGAAATAHEQPHPTPPAPVVRKES
ncbi:MAG: F0F1 ATP synthase subunit A [Candidatus Korobacteraceae bacterium]